MLKSMTKEPDQTPIKLTEESPSPMRRDAIVVEAVAIIDNVMVVVLQVEKILETSAQATVNQMVMETVTLAKKEKNKIIK